MKAHSFEKSTSTDVIWFVIAAVLLLGSQFVFDLSFNFNVPSSAVRARDKVHEDIDHIIERQQLVSGDVSVGYKIFPLLDESLVATSVLQHGYDSTATLLEQFGSPQFFYAVDISTSITLNFSGNQSRPRQYGVDLVQEVESSAYFVVYNSTGQRIGGCLQQDTVANSISDILLFLQPLLPQEYENLHFTRDTTANHLQFTAPCESSDIAAYQYVVFANVGPEGNIFAGFDRVPLSAQLANGIEASSLSLVTLPPMARAVAFGLFIFIILTCLVVFIVRSSKRALSFPYLISISVTMALMLTGASSSLFSNRLEIILFLALYQSIQGLLLYGVTSSSLISVALENIPEKFYTIHRVTLRQPISYFQGRSILTGIAFGIVLLTSGSLLSILGNALGLGWILAADLSLSAAGFYLVINPFVLIVSDTLQAALFFMLIAITAYSLAKRISDKKWLVLFIAGILILLGIVLQGILKNGSPVSLIVDSVVVSLVILYVIHKYDVLSVVAAGITFGLIALSPLWLQSTGLTIVAAGIGGGLLIFGVVGYRKKPEDVSPEDYKPLFLKEMDEQKRISEELSAAKTVQQRLLPTTLPVSDTLQCAAVCIPANEVGGDYYDVFSLPNGEVGVLVGDVSGKGLSAAFYITLAKGVIASQVQDSSDPAAVLHKVNQLLYDMMERGKFISMVYGVINPVEQTFTFANAGHPPSLLYSGSEQTTKFLQTKGMAIGLDRGDRFKRAVTSRCVKLRPQDMVVLYTDGVTEAMAANQQSYDEEGLIASLQKAGASPQAIVNTVIDDIEQFRGSTPQHDDITLFAFKLM